MRIKIGDTWHDPNQEPVMVELTKADQENIANMHPDAKMYCAYPDDMTPEQVEEWMKT